ncbi:MAG: 3-oxoacyl-ACP reductase FabG [Lachnospiraceae bacterium]|nr:3-oxoacyl-ACP reductase FabG [Lachnospiraceae bacterium]
MSTRPFVLITGASRGIGKAIAAAFAREGCELFLTCRRNIALLEELKLELERRYSVRCHICCCSADDPQQIERLFHQLPALDVLVNNAGISHVGLLPQLSIEEWRRVMSVNLDSLFYTCKMAIPAMLRQKKGRIINISSVWGNMGASMEVAYSASKGGVNSFTRALARELAPSNIQVNAIACGIIDTQMNEQLSVEELQSLIEEIPAGRLGRPEEVAELALLLSRAPEYLTGQIITLDGGWT